MNKQTDDYFTVVACLPKIVVGEDAKIYNGTGDEIIKLILNEFGSLQSDNVIIYTLGQRLYMESHLRLTPTKSEKK